MRVRYVSQPDITLGSLIESLFSRDTLPEKVTIVSAFVSLTTVLRLEEKLLEAADHGSVKLVVGVDLGGTSKEVLERILGWGGESFVIHHSNPRHTFHPKIFLFEFEDEAHLIVGSNNLTDGGLFSNFEAFTHSTFDFPSELGEYNSALGELAAFIEPSSPAACVLSTELISSLEERGELPTERQARTNRIRSRRSSSSNTTPSPFADEPLPTAPPLSDSARQTLREISATLPEDENTPESESSEEETTETASGEGPESETEATTEEESSPLDGATLVWRKKLPKSDALRVGEGTHHVGGVRPTQARFEDSPGQRIDQTTYFRRLFNGYSWTEERANPRTEHAFVPMTVIIRGSDYGKQSSKSATSRVVKPLRTITPPFSGGDVVLVQQSRALI